MKSLILAIYSNTSYYNEMLDIQRKYIHKNDCFDVYFVECREFQKEDIIVENDMIYLKGDERFLGITKKTIDALKCLFSMKKDIDYDYVIRTNVSTLINLDNLKLFLCTLPKNGIYTGGTLENLQWLDYKAGINEQSVVELKLQGLHYIQGTSIVFSKDVVKYILDNEHLVNHDIVDDVTFGLFVRTNLPDVHVNIKLYCNAKVIHNGFSHDAVFIRNRLFTEQNVNRCLDIIRMREIVDKCL